MTFDRGSLAALMAFGVGAAIYGVVTSRIPAPDSAEVFWVANVAAPYVAIPFAAALWQRSRATSVVGGVVAANAMIWGFYQLINSRTDDWLNFGLVFWYTLATVVGIIYGYMGYRWVRTRDWRIVSLVAGPFLLEPVLRAVQTGGVQRPVWIWPLEVLVGVSIGLLLLRQRSAHLTVDADSVFSR